MIGVILSYAIVFIPEFSRSYTILNDKSNCHLISDKLKFTTPTGLIIHSSSLSLSSPPSNQRKEFIENYFVSSSYSILKIKNENEIEKYIIPNIDIQALTLKEITSNEIYIGFQKPTNSIGKFNLISNNITMLFNLDQFLGTKEPLLEGLAYSKEDDIFYVNSKDGNIIGLKLNEIEKTIKAIHSIKSSSYLNHLKLDSHIENYSKISDISISKQKMFILFPNIFKMLILDLTRGEVDGLYLLPGTNKNWQSIHSIEYIVNESNEEEEGNDKSTSLTTKFWINLASDSPSQVWKFYFDQTSTYGFSSCSWN